MIRIVGIQRNTNPDQEFILMQNQGTMKAQLRGLAVMSDWACGMDDADPPIYVIPDEANIPSGAFILLNSGVGEPRWSQTKDGAVIYVTFLNRKESKWDRCSGPMHVLQIQHSYSEPKSAILV